MKKNELFPVTHIHRQDIQHALGLSDEATKKITKDQLEAIADKMGEAYLDSGFWIDLECISKDILNESESD